MVTDIARNELSDHRRSVMNSKRAYESLTIICVLADEVHTTGSIRVHGGSFVEVLLEEFNCLIT